VYMTIANGNIKIKRNTTKCGNKTKLSIEILIMKNYIAPMKKTQELKIVANEVCDQVREKKELDIGNGGTDEAEKSKLKRIFKRTLKNTKKDTK